MAEMSDMNGRSRALEVRLVERCALVGLGVSATADDRKEANVFRVAAMVVGSRHPLAAGNLRRASTRFFGDRPTDELPADEVVRQGWVTSLPRLRQLLEARLGA